MKSNNKYGCDEIKLVLFSLVDSLLDLIKQIKGHFSTLKYFTEDQNIFKTFNFN